MKRIIFVFALVLAISACSTTKNSKTTDTDKLEGATWKLTYITGARIAFEGLYPNEKPTVIFNLAENSIGGNTSCNAYTSQIIIEGNNITLKDPASTMRFCEGGGEQAFTRLFSKINNYKVTDNTLSFYMDDVEMMRFKKQ
ncbi:META domain-containing protein [Zhouia spongiae]|uniref:META domain-containing protein n=1 Tax=Zhouia spongiae TaxID=2202721 RepID=A0ABY3YK66_9FLAO|nr:META domain-containing protein [Zhouia spongiae]UNY97989.1 META domain-containing protein [Zhouia spongiae]